MKVEDHSARAEKHPRKEENVPDNGNRLWTARRVKEQINSPTAPYAQQAPDYAQQFDELSKARFPGFFKIGGEQERQADRFPTRQRRKLRDRFLNHNVLATVWWRNLPGNDYPWFHLPKTFPKMSGLPTIF